jgi:hypothetical protein
MNYNHDGKSEKENLTPKKETKEQATSSEARQISDAKMPKFESLIHKTPESSSVQKTDSGRKELKSENKTSESFMNSIKQGEEAIGAMVSSFTKLIEINNQFNSQLLSAFQDSKEEDPRKLLYLTSADFEACRCLAANNTKELSAWYDKHTSQAIAFHKSLADSLRIQSETILKMQSKGFEHLTDWAFDWWKTTEKETNKS